MLLGQSVLFFQELPRVLLPAVGSFRGGEEGVQVAATWRILLPQAGILLPLQQFIVYRFNTNSPHVCDLTFKVTL